MDDYKNNSHDLGSVLAIVAYTLLLIYYFKIWGLITSFSTIVGFLIISKNEKAIKDLLLKIKRIVGKLKRILQTKIPIWVTTLIVLVVLVLVYIVYSHQPIASEISKSIVFAAGYIFGGFNGTSPGTAPVPSATPIQTPVVSPTPTAILPNFTNSVGIEFVLIPAGEFDMGSPQKEAGRDEDEGPVHRVKIANAFNMSKYEITQKQWREVMGTNPSYFKGDNLPVEQVSWIQVQDFISRLNDKEGKIKYRLPSESLSEN